MQRRQQRLSSEIQGTLVLKYALLHQGVLFCSLRQCDPGVTWEGQGVGKDGSGDEGGLSSQVPTKHLLSKPPEDLTAVTIL